MSDNFPGQMLEQRITATSQFRPAPNIVFKVSEKGGVVVNVSNGKCWELNETGQLLWRLLEEGGAFEDAVAEVVRSFRVEPEVAEHDAHDLLTSLTGEGLLLPR